MTILNSEAQGSLQGLEQPRPFVATPERVSQYLELKTEEVTTQMRSVEGRQELFRQLMEHEQDLRSDHDDFAPESLQAQLEAAGETLIAHEHYLKDVSSPEKKGLFGRAWEAVKSFPRNHPVVTTLLASAAVAGGIAAGFYFAGNWELLMAATGLNKILTGAEAAGELIPTMPSTPPLPDGGLFDIPAPVSPPDIGSPI